MPAAERASITDELSPPYAVYAPAGQTAPVVLCSPHSGRVYTKAFLARSRLDPLTLRKSEDCYVDEIFAPAAGLGAPLLLARFPRAYLDANREPYELDPDLFRERLPEFANTRSVRVVGGLGTIARIVADGEEIYDGPLPLDVGIERIERLYKPFHGALAALVEETRQRFSYSVLVDCHSMPSNSPFGGGARRPDFVIGDRFGTACDMRLTRFLKETLSHMGYDVHINRPYAGGYITEHYGRPARRMHALQLEINRALYLDETTLQPTRQFAQLQQHMTHVVGTLMAAVPHLIERRLAAE